MVGSKGGEISRSLVARVFQEEGLPLKWYSDDYSDDIPHWIPYPGGEKNKGLLIVPYTLDANDYKNAGHQAFITPDDFSSYLIATFDELYREGVAGHAKMMSIGLHCRIVGRPARIAGLRKFLAYIKSKDGVWITTREQIADHWMAKFSYDVSA
jgi:peptidoglycan/xylan/chitin deacetylase (PgdA/CDA1 family)